MATVDQVTGGVDARPQRLHAQMALINATVTGADFEEVRPGRWKHLASGDHVETNYVYGEGRFRVYPNGQAKPAVEHIILGRPGDLDAVITHF